MKKQANAPKLVAARMCKVCSHIAAPAAFEIRINGAATLRCPKCAAQNAAEFGWMPEGKVQS